MRNVLRDSAQQLFSGSVRPEGSRDDESEDGSDGDRDETTIGDREYRDVIGA